MDTQTGEPSPTLETSEFLQYQVYTSLGRQMDVRRRRCRTLRYSPCILSAIAITDVVSVAILIGTMTVSRGDLATQGYRARVVIFELLRE